MAGRAEDNAIDTFVERFELSGFDHTVDRDGAVWSSYGVTGQPAFVFVHADGSFDYQPGSLGVDSLTSRVDALLAAA